MKPWVINRTMIQVYFCEENSVTKFVQSEVDTITNFLPDSRYPSNWLNKVMEAQNSKYGRHHPNNEVTYRNS